ncbi:uncharacterized protein LOC129928672 [Biomphalaria glabrata]|uniref:Uncharacterized protein LOC129928672 n=1 Tax=Biomphalaria glabrata TaxID=6526 RepID=A0A9W3BKK3_BIOGL|nr:uncharacterized protein LOC129928672 [Biomphalaria glabrata]KAI8761083.1 hypothetical protein BgiMline_008236 [Biomphalaria glabrata]
MDYFALFLCAGSIVLSGCFITSEACLSESSECQSLSQSQSQDPKNIPALCNNLSKVKSCYDKAIVGCKTDEHRKLIQASMDGTESALNTYCKQDMTCSALGMSKCFTESSVGPQSQGAKNMTDEDCRKVLKLERCLTELQSKCGNTIKEIDMTLEQSKPILIECKGRFKNTGSISGPSCLFAALSLVLLVRM